MKKTIYKYIFYEFTRYFTITLFALAVIVWTVQAVNFLDLVTEDGHGGVVPRRGGAARRRVAARGARAHLQGPSDRSISMTLVKSLTASLYLAKRS